MAKSDAERAREVRERRKAAGQKRVEYWLTNEEKFLMDVQLKMIRSRDEKSQPR